MPNLTLTIIPGRFAVCRFDPRAGVMDGVLESDFMSVTRTAEELSVLCREEVLPPEAETCERGWACLKVEGPLDFSLTGVLASLAGVLAEAGISIFAVSTFDTDYLLVKARDLDDAVVALSQARHLVQAQ